MLPDGKAVLFVVDKASHLSVACYLDHHSKHYGQSVKGIWLAILAVWCTIYDGHPNRMGTDQRFLFTSEKRKQLTDITGTRLALSGDQAHSSLKIGAQYRAPLRRIFRKIELSHPNTSGKSSLNIAVKAMKITMGGNGLESTRLVFGIILRLSTINMDRPAQKNRT